MDKRTRVSKRKLNQTAIDFLLMFQDRMAVNVRICNDPSACDRNHYVTVNGERHAFKRNADAYRFMADMMFEEERRFLTEQGCM